MVVPESETALNYFVEEYNKQYVIISDKKWKMYSKDGIVAIDLVFTGGGGYYFLMK